MKYLVEILVCAGVWNPSAAVSAYQVQSVRLSSKVFRIQASSTVQPVYPSQSLKVHHSGVVVVDVHVSPTGRVVGVEVLQSPDLWMSRSVQAAVHQWSFRPVTRAGDNHTAFEIVGRLFFYFTIDKGKPVIRELVGEQTPSGARLKSS